MKIKRLISVFDAETEELELEISIDLIPFEELKAFFNPSKKDPLMYNPYTIKIKHVSFLKRYIDINFDFNKKFYQIDCFEIS